MPQVFGNAAEPLIAPLRGLRHAGELDIIVAEGVETVRWLLRSDLPLGAVISKPSLEPTLAEDVADRPWVSASPAEMSALVGFEFTRGVIAWAPRPQSRPLKIIDQCQTWMVLDGVHDPINVGALVRTARCFGVDALVLGPGCADPWYRRTIRASVGHVFHLPLVTVTNLAPAIHSMQSSGGKVFAAHRGPAACDLTQLVAVPHRWAVVIGNEDRGPRPETLALCDQHLAIAMAPTIDSLNVNAAAAVITHALKTHAPLVGSARLAADE